MYLREFVLTRHVPNATDATNQIILTAPFDLKVISIQARQRVTSTSGTMDLVRVGNVVAISAGVSLLSAVMSLAGVADTNLLGALKTAIGGLDIRKGESLALIFSGTLTNLLDLDITLNLAQTRMR